MKEQSKTKIAANTQKQEADVLMIPTRIKDFIQPIPQRKVFIKSMLLQCDRLHI